MQSWRQCSLKLETMLPVMVVDFNNSTMSPLHLIMLATLMKIDEGSLPEIIQ